MPIITRRGLVVKNKNGDGIRKRENSEAVKKLADILKGIADLNREKNSWLAQSLDTWSGAFETLATTKITRDTGFEINEALGQLDGFEQGISQTDSSTGQSVYDTLVQELPNAGSSKAEFEVLLKTANEVLELGLENSVLKAVSPEEQRARAAQARQRQEELARQRQAQQERLRQEEQERQRLEQERQALEQERLRQARERQRLEQERLRQAELERQRQAEEERLRREQLAREKEQRRKARADALKLDEDYINTDFDDPDVAPIKLDPDYKEKIDDPEYAEDPLARLKQEREDLQAGPVEEPIIQKKATMIAQELEPDGPGPLFRDQFESFFEKNAIESAVDAEGRLYTTKEQMLEQLEESGSRLMLFGKDKEYAIAVERNGSRLYATSKAEQQQMGAESVSPDRLPEKKTLFGLKEDDILYGAADGKRFETPDAIRDQIRTGTGRLQIYTAGDRENPYIIDYDKGNASISNYTVRESQIEKLQKSSFRSCLPEEIEEKRILNWKESDIAYAEDAGGKRYEGSEELKKALYGTDKLLQVYTRDGNGTVDQLPFAVEKRNNRFYISSERVSAFKDQLAGLGEDLSGLEKEDFYQVYRPARSVLERNWRQDDIDFALDEAGNMYRGADRISEELDKSDDRTLFIFDKSGELPFALQKKDGSFYKSEDRISSRNIMPESRAYEAKKSLQVKDIVKIADRSEYSELKKQTDDLGKEKVFYEKNVEALQKASIKPVEPKKPVKPSLGFWNTVAYGLAWFFTAGRYETEAHRLLPIRMENYNKDMALYPERMKTFNARQKEYEDYLNGGRAKLEEYQAKLSEVSLKRNEVRQARRQAELRYVENRRGNDSADVNSYREKTEVRLEGVSDLRRNGVITPSNIFAHVWLKKAECNGRKASDPEARKAFCAFVAADAVKNDILNERVNSIELSDTVEGRKIQPLNSGAAVEELMKDKDLADMLDELGDEPINAQRLARRYMDKVSERTMAEKDDVRYLEDARTHMIESFGRQKLDEKTFDQFFRLKSLDNALRSVKNNIPTKDLKIISDRFEQAKTLESDAYRLKVTDALRYPYREAFEALKDQGPMDLREMSEAIEGKKAQLDARREAGGPQAHL